MEAFTSLQNMLKIDEACCNCLNNLMARFKNDCDFENYKKDCIDDLKKTIVSQEKNMVYYAGMLEQCDPNNEFVRSNILSAFDEAKQRLRKAREDLIKTSIAETIYDMPNFTDAYKDLRCNREQIRLALGDYLLEV